MNHALRRQWLATKVWKLGPRIFFEFVNELEKYGDANLDARLERYANFDPGLLRAVGADRVVPPPIHRVGGRQK